MKHQAPRLPEADVRSILAANNVDQGRVCAVAIRGYKLDTMGKPGVNDRRIYDDAHFICWPDGMAAFAGNTDPNGYRSGHGYGSEKGMACLRTGIHIYGTGLHKGRLAFRQCERFTVVRDGDPPYAHLGWHAINWHDGGEASTWSLGCQTNPGSIFKPLLRPMMYELLEVWKNPKRPNDRKESVRSFPYLLIDERDRRSGNLIVSGRYLSK